MEERELRRELDCCVHEAVFRDDVYRSEDHWRRAGKPYELNLRKQEGFGQTWGWPAYFESHYRSDWIAVPEWSDISEAFALIEASYSPAHKGSRDIWNPAYAVVRGNDDLWKVIWLVGSKIVSQARTPGVAVCLAVLRRVALFNCAGRDVFGEAADRQADEAVEQFRPLFTFESREAPAPPAQTPTFAGLPCLFPVEECEVGHFSKYEWLLEAGAQVPAVPVQGRQLLFLPSGAVFEQQGEAQGWGWKRIAYGGKRA
jgi:hypothetical protein